MLSATHAVASLASVNVAERLPRAGHGHEPQVIFLRRRVVPAVVAPVAEQGALALFPLGCPSVGRQPAKLRHSVHWWLWSFVVTTKRWIPNFSMFNGNVRSFFSPASRVTVFICGTDFSWPSWLMVSTVSVTVRLVEARVVLWEENRLAKELATRPLRRERIAKVLNVGVGPVGPDDCDHVKPGLLVQ